MFGGRCSGSIGTVSVTTMPVISAAARRSSASAVEQRVRHEHPDLRRAVLPQRRRARDLRAAGRRDVVADDRDLVTDARQ